MTATAPVALAIVDRVLEALDDGEAELARALLAQIRPSSARSFCCPACGRRWTWPGEALACADRGCAG
ncbi:MAG TPA: hypothetical protein VNK94_07330 [Gaiellaceae bacterium]|nr:hypothetical protein [Gaiellaceae bacterium]